MLVRKDRRCDSMSRCALLVLALLLVLGAGAGAEETAPAPGGESLGARSGPVVRAAPGGGEMIFLGADAQYVIRGQVTRDGDLEVGCTRDAARMDTEAESR
jgi:hypothetical protein